MTSEEMIDAMNSHSPPSLQKLGGRVLRYDEDRQEIEMKFQIDETFCHSGDIVQGGFVAGMLDASMAHAALVNLLDFVVVATLEIKVSYFDIARPGELRALGRVVRMGNSIAFLEAELRNETGDLLAGATSTAKVIHKKPNR